MGWLGPLFTIIVVGGLIFLMIYLFKNGMNKSAVSPEQLNDRSLDILKERYAKGDISDEEYDRRKKLLNF